MERSQTPSLLETNPKTGELEIVTLENAPKSPGVSEQLASTAFGELVSLPKRSSPLPTVPERIDHMIRGDDAAEDTYDAYAELGGGILRSHEEAVRTVESRILIDYEPWMSDVTMGVEELGILDVTAHSAQALNKKDRATFRLHLLGYTQRLVNMERTAAVPGNEFAQHIIQRLGQRTPSELRDYVDRLGAIEAHMRQSGLWDESGILRVGHNTRDADKHERLLKKDIATHGRIRIEKAKDGGFAVVRSPLDRKQVV